MIYGDEYLQYDCDLGVGFPYLMLSINIYSPIHNKDIKQHIYRSVKCTRNTNKPLLEVGLPSIIEMKLQNE